MIAIWILFAVSMLVVGLAILGALVRLVDALRDIHATLLQHGTHAATLDAAAVTLKKGVTEFDENVQRLRQQFDAHVAECLEWHDAMSKAVGMGRRTSSRVN